MKLSRIVAQLKSHGNDFDDDLKFTLIAALDESNQIIKAEWFGGYSNSKEHIGAFKMDSDGLIYFSDIPEKTNILDKVIMKDTCFSTWHNGLNDVLDDEDEWLFVIKSVHIYEY